MWPAMYGIFTYMVSFYGKCRYERKYPIQRVSGDVWIHWYTTKGLAASTKPKNCSRTIAMLFFFWLFLTNISKVGTNLLWQKPAKKNQMFPIWVSSSLKRKHSENAGFDKTNTPDILHPKNSVEFFSLQELTSMKGAFLSFSGPAH